MVPQSAVTLFCAALPEAVPPPPAIVAPTTPLVTLLPGNWPSPPNPPITFALSFPDESVWSPCRTIALLTEPPRLNWPLMVWSALKTLDTPSCANPLGPSPPSVDAFTLLTPDPLPEKELALTAPVNTLLAAPNCAKAFGERPPRVNAFTLDSPEPLPPKFTALRLPPTLRLVPDWDKIELLMVELLVQMGMKFVVPVPLTVFDVPPFFCT